MHRRRFTRRAVLVGGLAAAGSGGAEALSVDAPPIPSAFDAIERRVGGRLGVAAINTATGLTILHRADERFAMCSMFKWLLAAQILRLNEQNPGFLDRRISFNEAYLASLGHAPATRAHLSQGWMSIADLADAAVTQSDNGAANLLLERAGGPNRLTQFLRQNGDAETRLDRNEPALNEILPGDPRDTTTPVAMAHTMIRFLTTDAVLSRASRAQLSAWLVANQTGGARLRAGLPAAWRVGDKTGTSDGAHNATTDVAICWPPGASAPIVIACFLSESTIDMAGRNAAHADVARTVAETWSA